MNAKLMELLAESRKIQETIRKQKEELKERKVAMATEYTKNFTTEEKAQEVKNCETIFLNAKKEYDEKRKNILSQLKNEKILYKEKILFAKERMFFLSGVVKNSLQKTKNSFRIEKNLLYFNREGIKEITIDISKVNWEKNFKQELAKQGINGDDRIADNIVYKAQCLLKSNITI